MKRPSFDYSRQREISIASFETSRDEDSSSGRVILTSGRGGVKGSFEDKPERQTIGCLMASLDERYSVPFLLFYRGYECQEIGHYLGLPITEVKNRIFVARHKLRGTLDSVRRALSSRQGLLADSDPDTLGPSYRTAPRQL